MSITIAMPRMSTDPELTTAQSKYVESLARAGASVRWVELADPDKAVAEALECAGLLLPGGGDIAPTFYGQSPLPQLTATNRTEDTVELIAARLAHKKGMPVLGVCRGCQSLNVAFGGTLWQDVPTQCAGAICHKQDLGKRDELFHSLALRDDSYLAEIMGGTAQESNTFHHQAVHDIAKGFTAVAHTPDGLIEAIESDDGTILGVQWHPENLAAKYPAHAALFTWLVQKAEQRTV